MEELSKAFHLYRVPIADALESEDVQITSYDFKDNHDIDELGRRMRVVDLNIDSVDPINAIHWGGQLRILRKKEGERCINAAIFFQAMMEAVINDHLVGAQTDRPFAEKWEMFLENNGAPSAIEKAFKDYKKNIYRNIRIPAVHAKRRVGGLDAASLRFPIVHAHLKSGWHCFAYLTGVKHDSPIDPDTNWKTMCDIHGLPAIIEIAELPDMDSLSKMMYERGASYFNQVRQADS